MTNLWKDLEHALGYLERADSLLHRTEGESALLEEIPVDAKRILDLGTGDGRLMALALLKAEGATGVALDFSDVMLEKSRERFADDPRVSVVAHDMSQPLPELGDFDIIISSFAIHHLEDARKRELYTEVWDCLLPGGVFCNLEHVSSPTDYLHERFNDALGKNPGKHDPSNKLLDMQIQLDWFSEIGFNDVDCLWKWRELALLAGRKQHNLKT